MLDNKVNCPITEKLLLFVWPRVVRLGRILQHVYPHGFCIYEACSLTFRPEELQEQRQYLP